MYSVAENNNVLSIFDTWDLKGCFRIKNTFHTINLPNIEQVFFGENLSLKEAIDQKKAIQCFIEIEENNEENFLDVGTISLAWNPKENECRVSFFLILLEYWAE